MTGPKIPEWVSALSLNEAVYSILGTRDKILAVLPNVDDIQFRNCTVLLPLKVKIQQKDQTVRKVAFLLKAQNGGKFQAKTMSQLKMFQREHQMYHCLLPKFEKLYESVGKTITFGPRAFHLDQSIGVNYILMEDLKARGYKNMERQMGLDQVYLKQVLRKLAELHAVSAIYAQQNGMYSKLITQGVYTQKNRLLLKELNDADSFLAQLKRCRVCVQFHKRLMRKEEALIDRMLDLHKVRSNEFNVLNHSDCWVNHVMFKHDGFGNVEDTVLLDFQGVKYGSPAHDLYYTILTSAQREIKLEKFDYFVQYYFYYLLENLKCLKYQRTLPELMDIRKALSDSGLAAYVVVSRVLPIVMMYSFENEINERYTFKMKSSMFTNRKFIQAMNEILPWMDNRGLLDWS